MSLQRNIAANYVGRAYSLLAVYLFVPFYVSMLGIDAYGLIALNTLILSLTAMADVGLSAAFSREAARAADRRTLIDLLTTVEVTLLVVTGAAAAVVFFLAESITTSWIKPESVSIETTTRCIQLLALNLPFQIGVNLYLGGLLGVQDQLVANIAQVAYTTLRSGIVLLPLWLSPKVEVFFAWQLAASAICFVVIRSILVIRLGHRAFAVGAYALRTLSPVLNFAGGMLVISVSSALSTQLDKVVVSKLFSVEQFGYYSLASMLAQLPYAVTAPFLIALLPKWTSMLAAERGAELQEHYRKFSHVIALISSVGAFGLVLFATDVLSVWLHRSAVPEEVAHATRVLALGGLLLALAALPFYFGLAHGHNRTSVWLGSFAVVVSPPLLVYAASRYGLVGAAVPWVLINGLALGVLARVVHGSLLPGGGATWCVRTTGRAVVMGAAVMVSARFVVDSIEFGPVGACLTAGLFAAGGIFLATRPSSIRRWS